MTDNEPTKSHDEVLAQFVDEVQHLDLSSPEATTAMKNLETFSKIQLPQPEPVPAPIVVPTTPWGRFAAAAARALDNETTRTIIKAGGAFGGVALVTFTTIKRDHVVERQALQQANQRPS